jgi:spore coat polysaccharide biosynthesis predicted glycosyltransferase SpsG
VNWTVVIPARVGSQGVKDKNYAEVGGNPLILWAVYAALGDHRVSRVVVWTNDSVVEGIIEARFWENPRVAVVDRPKWTDLPGTSVDELVNYWMMVDWAEAGPDTKVAFLQPTVYPPDRFLSSLIAAAEEKGKGWWVAAVPNRHLHWGYAPDGLEPLETRAQRQTIFPEVFDEVGVRACIGPRPDRESQYTWKAIRLEVSQWVDIDTPHDLEVARELARPKRSVVFNLVADEERGYGHLYRCLEVASELQTERVGFTGDLDSKARAILDARGWDYDADWEYGHPADVMVVDRLDTTRRQMADFASRAGAIVTFENLGGGARMADAVINDMYWNSASEGEYSGFEWTILRPEFRGLPPYQVRPEFERVLVTMGGTDPSRFTEYAAEQLGGMGGLNVRVVVPPGRELEKDKPSGVTWLYGAHMAKEMIQADVVVCSAGRTLLEAAAVGVPALVVAQNEREARHGGLHRIGWYLGWAHTTPDLGEPIMRLSQSQELRAALSRATKGLIDGKGVHRVARLIRDLGSR